MAYITLSSFRVNPEFQDFSLQPTGTDFGPLLANPRTLLLGAAAQFGIFATVLGALTLNYFGLIAFTLPQAAAIGIIGGADGPTAIYLSGKLAPELLGAIAVAAYSYMALVSGKSAWCSCAR